MTKNNINGRERLVRKCVLNWMKCCVEFESVEPHHPKISKYHKKSGNGNSQKILNKFHGCELLRNKFYWLESGFLWCCYYTFFSCSEFFSLRMLYIAGFCFYSLYSVQQKSAIKLISHLPWYQFSISLISCDGIVVMELN